MPEAVWGIIRRSYCFRAILQGRKLGPLNFNSGPGVSGRMAARKATVSMKDVAALAGVSLGTVSNVLNSPDLVAEPTRHRVEVAIAKLGWIPNEPARQLRAGRSRSIGVIVMDITNPFFTDLVIGAENYVYEHGYSVQV